MTSTEHGKSYITMYWMIMPPSNAEKSGKDSVNRNLLPQKYVKPLVTGMLSSVKITSQERLTTRRPTESCVGLS